MKKIKKSFTIIFAWSVYLQISGQLLHAGTAEKVHEWFAHQNYVNVTDPGVYQGQSARYMTLGGLSTRSEITRPFRMVDIQTPKFSAGCGGIDFYTGGLSAVNADQFIEGLRSIGQNVQSLAFMLAIQIVSPQLSGVMEDIQTWANKYLNMNLDSCQAATKMVGGTLDYFGAKEGNCVVKRIQDFSESWDVAKHNCTTGGKIKATEASGEPNRIDFIKGNIAWYVLMQDPFFKTDLEFAELVMNLTGTIILADSLDHSNDDGPGHITVIDPALVGEVSKERFNNIYSSLLNGTQSPTSLMIYRCQNATADPQGCTTVTPNLVEMKPNWDGLKFRIQQIVRAIVQKIHADEPLNQEEKGVISSTTIPLYRFLTVTSAYFPRNSDITRSINDYIELIAEDILLRSLNAIIAKVEQQTSMTANSESKRVLAYKLNVQKVLKGLSMRERDNLQAASKYLEMQQRIQMYEKTLMSRLSSGIVTSTMWGSR